MPSLDFLVGLSYRRSAFVFAAECAVIILWLFYGLRYLVSNQLVLVLIGLLALTEARICWTCDITPEGSSAAAWASLAASFSWIAANHDRILSRLDFFPLLISGYLVFRLLASILIRALQKLRRTAYAGHRGVKYSGIVFGASFLGVIVIDLSYLILRAAPCIFTNDTKNQLLEIASGSYSTFHPYWHTRLLGAIVGFGTRAFGDINAGLSFYCVLQIIAMAAVFSFCLSSMYEAGFKGRLIVLAAIFYLLAPYNVIYGSTPWKDIPFSLSVLLFALCTWRVSRNMTGRRRDYALMVLSCLLMGTMRKNGPFALAAILIAVVCVKSFDGHYRRLAATASLVGIFAGTVLPFALGAAPGPVTESLSVPLQQIARTVRDDWDYIPEEDRELISRAIPFNSIPDRYSEELSDPIKYAIDQESLKANAHDLALLWIRLGIQHPYSYLVGYIDLTRAYWNPAGRPYWIWVTYVLDNDLGIVRTIDEQTVLVRSIDRVSDFMSWSTAMGPIRSCGTWIWATFLLFVLAIREGEGGRALLFAPVLGVLASLMIGTSVSGEFRYVYSVFLCMPIFIAATLLNGNSCDKA